LEHVGQQRVGLLGAGRLLLIQSPETAATSLERGAVGSNARRSRMASGTLAEGGTPYLYEFHCPCFDVPLSLWDAADVIIDEETFGCDSEDEPVRYGANSGDQL
jgi:hypothetical protein